MPGHRWSTYTSEIPQPKSGARDPARFREVVRQLNESGTDIVLNLTCGMNSALNLSVDDPGGYARRHGSRTASRANATCR